MIPDPFSSCQASLIDVLGHLQALNDKPETRSRELSLAITNIQQGLLWLGTAPAQNAED